MTQEEGNKIIAEFMGKEFKPYRGNKSCDNPFPTYDQCMDFIVKAELEGYKPELGWKMGMGKYHESWSWLMPVVEKIERLNSGNSYLYSVEMGRDYCVITTNDFTPETLATASSINDKRYSVWLAVTRFIQWYNTQPSHPQH